MQHFWYSCRGNFNLKSRLVCTCIVHDGLFGKILDATLTSMECAWLECTPNCLECTK